MVRLFRKSQNVALVLVLMGTLAGEIVVCGQSGFIDENSHVPPSPSSSSSFQVAPAVGMPAPAVANPKPSTSTLSPAYQMSRLPQANPRTQRSPSQAPGKNSAGKIGPYGVGGRVGNTTEIVRTAARAGQNPPASSSANSGVQTAAHYDETADPGFSSPVPPPAPPSDMTAIPSPLFSRSAIPPINSGSSFPTERSRPPTIMGSHLGLHPGETATERSLRLMAAVGELERQVDAQGQRNAELTQTLSQRDEQLLTAIREIKSARKDVNSARDELERLRQQIKVLQDKVRDAERDNASLLQTLAPLLQKLLENDGDGASPGLSEE